MSLSPVEISIFVSTYNGENKIINLLDSLSRQSFKKFELIIVIDGSRDNTFEILNTYKSKFDRLTIINKKSNNGKPYCLNLASKSALGEILLFFDDDMILSENCVLHHYEFHQKQIQASILTGNGYRNPESANRNFDFHLIACEQNWKAAHPNDFRISLSNFVVTSCNMSMPKSIFEQLNGFNERLTDLEDADIAIRALENNIPVYYKQSLLAWHNDFPTLKLYIKRLTQYHAAKIKLLTIHPGYKRLLPQVFDMKNNMLKRIALFPFRAKFLLTIDSLFNKFNVVPNKTKFIIYNLIIASHSGKNE